MSAARPRFSGAMTMASHARPQSTSLVTYGEDSRELCVASSGSTSADH
ncbi:hypothetical protein [Streptomyces sp. DASNCL29]|nr:hypothetical protein [Streptomyces sp. DASNCL29]